ncbi:hypothetical protein [Tahibacter amnicola]|uniref:Transcription elongation GreA/GreB family factor n=1 Tax=Tahibacter amnicola TaxID=2976241 RepID=A0ABY6B9M4_9GAMM|nr:hypothetical protein [Tahibacter amnicola]UXI66554.1 hypothetical protein N4264_17600 [Tahibacter amnicola]
MAMFRPMTLSDRMDAEHAGSAGVAAMSVPVLPLQRAAACAAQSLALLRRRIADLRRRTAEQVGSVPYVQLKRAIAECEIRRLEQRMLEVAPQWTATPHGKCAGPLSTVLAVDAQGQLRSFTLGRTPLDDTLPPDASGPACWMLLGCRAGEVITYRSSAGEGELYILEVIENTSTTMRSRDATVEKAYR